MTEVNILELDTRDPLCNDMTVGFRWNFTEGTSKEIDYLQSPYMRTFTMSCLKAIKNKEGKEILAFSPRKKEDTARGANAKKIEQPNNGREFFFSNVLMKVYQVPVIFLRNSEEEYSDS